MHCGGRLTSNHTPSSRSKPPPHCPRFCPPPSQKGFHRWNFAVSADSALLFEDTRVTAGGSGGSATGSSASSASGGGATSGGAPGVTNITRLMAELGAAPVVFEHDAADRFGALRACWKVKGGGVEGAAGAGEAPVAAAAV